jgi:uncharacterized membrane protein
MAADLNMRIFGFGRILFGISAAGLALLSLIYGNFAPIVEPFPGLRVWPYGLGAILLAASGGLFVARTARAGAVTIAVYEAAWAGARAHALVLKPLSVGSWYGLCEALGPLVGVWVLYALLRRQNGAPIATMMTGDRALRLARVLFGAACVGYGAAHFAYAAYTAKMVPAWLPGRTGIAYLTGAFHAAAGIGLLLGVLPRMAATLEAMMLSLFGVLVWMPNFFTHPMPEWAPSAQVQWSETLLTFLLAGSAWILAASLQRTSWGFAASSGHSPVTAR